VLGWSLSAEWGSVRVRGCGWVAAKAAVGRFEMLDLNDMGNYYYIYVCKKSRELWDQKLVKLGKKKKKR
jgi:hypothetical protein